MEIDKSTTTSSSTLDENGDRKKPIKSSAIVFDPISTVRDAALILQRRRDSTFEDECYTRDESSLYLVNESQDSLARRCIDISNIFRNLSFVPGNETILAKSSRFLAILGRLLLLNHEHLQRTPKTRNYDREEDTDFSDSCSSLQGEREWWWEYLIHIRENMLVAIANIAGHLELARYEELIARPLIDGLLHWAVCPSAHGQDPFPSCGPHTLLSPQRLALEALCKLCVTDANVDLVIATPPFTRLEKLCAVLTRHLCRNEDQVLREFSVNLLHYLAAADSAMARTVALQSPCISYLVAFIEQAEQTALGVANQHGINYLRENPDAMGTSLDMLRRAAGTLLHLARHPDNRSLFMQQEQRLLGLVMSHILDQQVALVISRVLFQVSRGPGPMPSLEYRNQQRQQNDMMTTTTAASDSKKPKPTNTHNKNTTDNNSKSETVTTTTTVTSTSLTTTTTSKTTPLPLPTSESEKAEKPVIMEESQTTVNELTTTTTVTPPTGATAVTTTMMMMSTKSTVEPTVHELKANNLGDEKITTTPMPPITPNTNLVDENSNSNSQLPPTAVLNDVSNSSTNSNSCSTAASIQSGSVMSNSNSSCHLMSNNNTNNINVAPTTVPVNLNSNMVLAEQQQPQHKHNILTNTTPMATAPPTIAPAATTIVNNCNDNNMSLNNSNGNSRGSSSSNSSSISNGSNSNGATTMTAATTGNTTVAPAAPPAVTTPSQSSSATATAATTAAVA